MKDIQTSSKSPLGWRNILAPVDFSESSRQALKIAAGLAEQSGAALTLLHIVHVPSCFPMDALIDLEELISVARDSLEKMCREIPPAIIRQKLVQFGKQSICQEIIEASFDLPADLIVVTAHRHGELVRVLHGCIAERIIRDAPCPVLVTHAAQKSPHQVHSSVVEPCLTDQTRAVRLG